MKTMEDSTEITGLVLYQTLYYLLSVFHSKFSKVKDNFQLQYKIQNSRRYL